MDTEGTRTHQSLTEYIADQISKGNYTLRFEDKDIIDKSDEFIEAISYLARLLAKQEDYKKQLSVDISHELRTPLSIVSTHLEAMIEGIWNLSVEHLQSCYDEIGKLSMLVSDLEMLAQFDNDGNYKLQKSYIDLMDIAQAGFDCFHIDAQNKNLTFVIQGTSTVVYADRNMMNIVIKNLLSNAIKYTQNNGSIRILVINSENDGVLAVEDDGIGIPEHELPIIMERFYRFDKSRNRKTGGTGIGLAVVKAIIKAHNGTIDVESSVGQGSRFIVSLLK